MFQSLVGTCAAVNLYKQVPSVTMFQSLVGTCAAPATWPRATSSHCFNPS